MTDITKFKAIFKGLEIAYGTYRIESSRGDGKQAGKAVVVRKQPTDDLWAKHLEGIEPSLGIIPIREDNSCIWGCIDIDQYPLDHAGLIKKVRSLDLPMVVCRSKSGGAHVFLFVKEPIPAANMQRFLKASAALLGEAGREIFPKQSEILVDRGDTGNFLNLPYFGGDKTLRYAIKDDGSAATLEEFYALHQQWVQDPDLKFPEEPKEPEHPIKDGPPCLQALCSQGVPEGTRNNALFNIGIYLKKVIPIHWDDALVAHNMKYVIPPLPNNEVQILVKQLNKKEYHSKCKDAPLNSFCNSGLCRTRKYGIGANGPDAPQMSSLSKYNSEPPLWFLDINGKRIELDTESLFAQVAFQKACVEKLNILPPTLRKQDWEQLLNALLKEMVETEQITEASEDTSITGRFNDLLEEFCTHLQQAMDRDEILMGRPWTDDTDAKTYFRMKDLEAHLIRNNFKGMTHPKMAQRIRDLGGEPISLFLKNRAARCWRVSRFNRQDSPFETPEQRTQRSPF
jgi:hypothetical protein